VKYQTGPNIDKEEEPFTTDRRRPW